MQATIRNEKRGWIRWRAVALLAIGAAITGAYGGFFFDAHLRQLLEDIGTRQNGARVNIASLHLSWWAHRLEIGGIQIARTSEPMRNLLVFDRVSIDFAPSALLRNKLIIDDLRVEGVHYGTPRESSGELAWETVRTGMLGPGVVDRSSNVLYPALLSRYPENPLGRLARFSMGLDVQNKFEAHRDHLRSLGTLHQIGKELDAARGRWREYAAHLPSAEWMSDRRTRLREPQRVLASASPDPRAEVQREVRATREEVQQAADRYRKEADSFNQRLAEVGRQVDSDIQDLRATLGLPSLDAKDLTPLIFGPRLTSYFGRLSYWIDLARRRMPTGTRQGLIFGGAASGVDVHFAKMSTLPAMVLRKATLVSDTEKEPGGGHVRGGCENVTGDPPIVGQPAKFWLDADFPSAHIEQLHFTGVIDHVGEHPRETFDFSLAAAPLAHWPLHNGSDLSLFIERGVARATFHGEFKDTDTDAHWTAQVHNIDYRVTTPYLELSDRLRQILDRLPDFVVTGTLKGSGAAAKLTLESSFGKMLAASLPAVFKNPLGAIDDSIRKFILDEVDEPRRRMANRTQEWRDEVDEQTTRSLRQLDQLLAVN